MGAADRSIRSKKAPDHYSPEPDSIRAQRTTRKRKSSKSVSKTSKASKSTKNTPKTIAKSKSPPSPPQSQPQHRLNPSADPPSPELLHRLLPKSAGMVLSSRLGLGRRSIRRLRLGRCRRLVLLRT
ncbi:hypothetical protein ABVK25_008262 [Lepraria finkii]|uniref:Uncharacterized protein n=1 Tax=Lepraria finkii TaxID=1340010 RepID=A0ABR4B0G9_9LECA